MLNLKPIPEAQKKASKPAVKKERRDSELDSVELVKKYKVRASKSYFVHQMCMLMGIGEGATPSNQVYADGYFGNSLKRDIESAGYTVEEIQADAKLEAVEYMKRQIRE